MRITIETSITVTDVERAARALRELTAQYGGYVGEARSGGNEAARSAWFELHIPVARLVAFRTGVAALGRSRPTPRRRGRHRAARGHPGAPRQRAREEKRMLELLDKRAGTLADIVAVEKELASVRETIERMEAQERVLEGQIASATIRVHLATRHPEARLSPSRRIARAAGDGVNAAGEFLVGAAVVGVAAAPTLLILAAIGFVVFRFVRSCTAVRTSSDGAQPRSPGLVARTACGAVSCSRGAAIAARAGRARLPSARRHRPARSRAVRDRGTRLRMNKLTPNLIVASIEACLPFWWSGSGSIARSRSRTRVRSGSSS